MRTRTLGPFQVAPLAFGGNVFGWTIDEAVSFKLLDACIEAGINLIDTADVYSRWAPGNQGGESETIIGNWLKKTGNRSKIVLATKLGKEMGPTDKGLSAKYIHLAVERSLNRLQTDSIDLYQSHEDDKGTPLEETLGAFGELIAAGKVKAIGASNYSGARLAEALKISKEKGLPAYCCLQPHYSLAERAIFEPEYEALCLAERIAVIPYYSLAGGFLTGKYRSLADAEGKVRGARAKLYLNERGFKLLKALDEVAERLKTTQGRVALAWLMARPVVTAPIASATTVEQLRDLVEATRLELDDRAINALDEASA